MSSALFAVWVFTNIGGSSLAEPASTTIKDGVPNDIRRWDHGGRGVASGISRRTSVISGTYPPRRLHNQANRAAGRCSLHDIVSLIFL